MERILQRASVEGLRAPEVQTLKKVRILRYSLPLFPKPIHITKRQEAEFNDSSIFERLWVKGLVSKMFYSKKAG